MNDSTDSKHGHRASSSGSPKEIPAGSVIHDEGADHGGARPAGADSVLAIPFQVDVLDVRTEALVLAVLKSGAAYVPVDPASPASSSWAASAWRADTSAVPS